MENTVNTVEQFVAVKKMAGVDDRGLVQLELTDGTVIGVGFGYMNMIICHYPDGIYEANPVWKTGTNILTGFMLTRKAVNK